MSIKNIKGNLLDFPEGCTIIAHCANCQNTFGSGIARQIKEEYPLAYEADTEAAKNKSNQLGQFSIATLNNGKKIVNIYGQNLYNTKGSEYTRMVDYEAIYLAMEELHRLMMAAHDKGRIHTLGIPKLMGCARAGGSWRIISAMLEEIFLDSPIKLVIVEYVGKDEFHGAK